jgi:hypothetical protein
MRVVRNAVLASLSAALFLALVPLTASAAEGKRPLIISLSSGVGGEITVGGDIDPEGLETTYEIKLESDGQHVKATLPADYAGHEVRLTLTGLQPGYYSFSVHASNSAGEASQRGEVHVLPGSPCPEGCPGKTAPPYETKVSPESEELARLYGEGAPARQAARERLATEQAEREAAAKRADQPTPTAPISEPPPATGGVSLANTRILVQANGVALVLLECLGSATCRGNLTLSAKLTAKAGAKRKRAGASPIARASFSIAGDHTKTIKLHLNVDPHALLASGPATLTDSLELLELAPSSQNTRTFTVALLHRPSNAH